MSEYILENFYDGARLIVEAENMKELNEWAEENLTKPGRWDLVDGEED